MPHLEPGSSQTPILFLSCFLSQLRTPAIVHERHHFLCKWQAQHHKFGAATATAASELLILPFVAICRDYRHCRARGIALVYGVTTLRRMGTLDIREKNIIACMGNTPKHLAYIHVETSWNAAGRRDFRRPVLSCWYNPNLTVPRVRLAVVGLVDGHRSFTCWHLR